MNPKILGLAGSPRKGGNSDQLLDAFLNGAQTAGGQIKIIRVSQLNIEPCQGCAGCQNTGQCVQQDDMQPIYQQLLEASGIVMATPLYFMGPTAQLKTFIDRCQALWVRKYVLKIKIAPDQKRQGFLISAAGSSMGEKAFVGLKTTMEALGYVLDLKLAGCLLFSGLDKKGVVSGQPQILKQCFEAGKKFVQELLDE